MYGARGLALIGRKRLRRWCLLGVVVGIVAYLCLPPAPLTSHAGDGEFADISLRGNVCGLPILNFRGFAVSMPRFDLGVDHTATYRVSRLPDIGRPCHLYLAIEDANRRWFMRDADIRKLQGSLRLEVLGGQGEIIRQSEGPLKDYRWGFWGDAHRLYHDEIGPLEFPAHRGEEYALRVVYHADPALAGYEGYCYLECRVRK